MGINLEKTNYIFATKNKTKKSSDSLETAYSSYSFNTNKGKEIAYWEIRNHKKKNMKVLWSKKEEMSKLYIKNKSEILYENIDGLYEAYKTLIKNAKNIFSKNKVVEIVNEVGQIIIKPEPKDLKIILELLTILDRSNAKYMNCMDTELKDIDLSSILFELETSKTKTSIEEKIEKNGISKENKLLCLTSEINNKGIENGILDKNKLYYLKIKLSNSEIIERADNPHSYKETMKLYQDKKDVYKFADVYFIREEINKEPEVLFNKPKLEKDYLYSGTLKLYENIITNYKRLLESMKNSKTELSVKDKEISSYKHKLENTTIRTDKEARAYINTEKILLHERRDVKLALLLNNLMKESLDSLKDVENNFNKSLERIDKYIKYGFNYEEDKFRIKKYEYKDDFEKNQIISELSKENVEFRINTEDRYIYAYS